MLILAGVLGALLPATASAASASSCRTIGPQAQQITNYYGRPLAGFSVTQTFCYSGTNVIAVYAPQLTANVTGTGGLGGWNYDGILQNTNTCVPSGISSRYSCTRYIQVEFTQRLGVGPLQQQVGSWTPWVRITMYYQGTGICSKWSTGSSTFYC